MTYIWCWIYDFCFNFYHDDNRSNKNGVYYCTHNKKVWFLTCHVNHQTF